MGHHLSESEISEQNFLLENLLLQRILELKKYTENGAIFAHNVQGNFLNKTGKLQGI